MEGVKLAIPVDVVANKLMGSEVYLGARVCANDGDSDAISAFGGAKIDECGGTLLGHRGPSSASESSPWIKNVDTESCRSNGLLSRLATEDVPLGLENGVASNSFALMSASEGKHAQRRAGKVSRNGVGSCKRMRMLQTDNVLPQHGVDDSKIESDKLGAHLVKCSNADKSAAVKTKSNLNGKRGDRRNSKVQLRTKVDPFSPKGGLPSFNPASGGSNVFGMYGLKPDIHDVTKLIDDITLEELLDGSYTCPAQVKDKGKRPASVNDNILDSVRKACSVLRLQGLQQGKQTEDVDTPVTKKTPSLSSPSNASAPNGSDGDENNTASSSKCSKDQESCMKAETPIDVNNSPLYQPKDILERLALPPPKDLDSLLQDGVKPSASGKLSDSRSGKPFSHRVALPPFSWSNNFTGHYKSNSDAQKISSRSTCQGRWVRIRSTASFVGGGNDGFLDLDSITYDDSLVPTGQVKYSLPEIQKTSSTFFSQEFCQQDLYSERPAASVPHHESGCTSEAKKNAVHSPTVLTAAQTLCDIATHCTKNNLNGILKWPKQPSQKAMKARKSRSNEKIEEDFLTPKSETVLDQAVRSVEYGSSSKKPKFSVLERREDSSHVQAVIGLSSVSAPRSSRASPIRRESVAETRHCNGNFTKSPFMVPPPPRVPDRNNHNPQKLRKVVPMDWNRTRM